MGDGFRMTATSDSCAARITFIVTSMGTCQIRGGTDGRLRTRTHHLHRHLDGHLQRDDEELQVDRGRLAKDVEAVLDVMLADRLPKKEEGLVMTTTTDDEHDDDDDERGRRKARRRRPPGWHPGTRS